MFYFNFIKHSIVYSKPGILYPPTDISPKPHIDIDLPDIDTNIVLLLLIALGLGWFLFDIKKPTPNSTIDVRCGNLCHNGYDYKYIYDFNNISSSVLILNYTITNFYSNSEGGFWWNRYLVKYIEIEGIMRRVLILLDSKDKTCFFFLIP